MAASPSGTAAGLLLIVGGVWLLLQTLVAGLPSRIVGLSGSGKSSSGSKSSTPSSSTGSGSSSGPSTSSSSSSSLWSQIEDAAAGAKTSPAAQNTNNPSSPPAPTF